VNFAESQRNPGKHPTGLIIVIIMHVLLAYAIVSGLGKRVIEKVMVTETKLVEAPPPPPPPPPKDLPPPPKALPPPPVYVPPPPVDVPPPPLAPAITTTTIVPPPPAEVRVQAPTPAPPAPAVSRASPPIIKATDPSCRPDYPAAALRAGATGVSHIRFAIDANGKVTGAEIIQSAGGTREHKMLDRAAQAALAQCPITVGHDAEGKALAASVDVAYTWKLTD
jgi:protein TonB